MAKQKKPSRWDVCVFRPHRYSPELELDFRLRIKAHMANEARLFTLSLEILDGHEIPQAFIEDYFNDFDLQYRDSGKGPCVGMSHHVNRIIAMWKARGAVSYTPKTTNLFNPLQ